MRQLGKITMSIAAASLVLSGCGSSQDGESSSSGSSDICDQGGDGPKVGLAYDVGGRGDQSFNDAAYAGLEKAVKEVDASCTQGEAQDGEPESAREDRLRQMADAGYNPIIGVGFAYSDSVNVVAPDYPDVNFAVIDGFDPDDQPNENVAYLGFAEHEGSFLVGVAAALKTKADQVGFVGGVASDLIKKFEAGYAAGVKAVDPKIKVDVKYIEQTDLKGFNDPAGGKAAATALYDGGADIVYHASGGSGAGVFDAAAEAGDGMWAIGVDSDQYLTAAGEVQDHILTSMLKKVDVATFDMVQSVADGKPLTSYQTYDLKVDGVGYSTSGGFIDDITDQIDKYADQITSGEIKVPEKP